jgi:hypothetical protein
MKVISFIAAGIVTAFVALTVFAADKKQTEPAADVQAQAKVAELSKEVDALQGKIKGLEKRIQKLEEKQTPIVTVAPLGGGSIFTVPQAIQNPAPIERGFADPAHPPKIWGEGECNGWKFYTIPLSAAGTEAAMPIPLAGQAAASH